MFLKDLFPCFFCHDNYFIESLFVLVLNSLFFSLWLFSKTHQSQVKGVISTITNASEKNMKNGKPQIKEEIIDMAVWNQQFCMQYTAETGFW